MATSFGSTIGARSTKKTPSRKSEISSQALSSARRVLPVPPAGQGQQPSVGAPNEGGQGGKLEPTTHEGCQRRGNVALRTRRRQRKFRILAQDRPLELLQLGPRLDAELFDERLAARR